MKKMQNPTIEKPKRHILIKIIEYVPDSVVTRNIIRRTTDDVSVIAIDTGQAVSEKISPFDTFLQVIEGTAEVVIKEKPILVKTGESLVVPAYTSYNVQANRRFKMISTIIKSGYEKVLI